MLLKELLEIINGYMVGGCVRDIYMQRTPNDYDVVTTLTPEEVRERVPIAYAIGEKFGTLCIETTDVGIVEVTSARADITAGRHPTVCFTTDIIKDLQRRDFTMNALLMDASGNMFGAATGIKDIDNDLIRCVGAASDRLHEDRLRALRAIRFSLQLWMDIDVELSNTLYNFDLKIGTELAGTRVMDELKKMFAVNAAEAIQELDSYNLLIQIFPEVVILKHCKENQKWHIGEDTSFVHTMNVLQRAQKYNFTVQIAALLHDIGKAVVRKNICTSYHGHARAGKLLIQRIAERLLWSNDLREACEFVCENHMKMHVIEEMRPFKRRELYMNDHFNTLYHVHICDIGDRADINHIQWIIDDMKKLCAMPALITGHDIVKRGIVGKRVGELKELCHEAQLRGDFDSHATGIEYLKGLLESD